MTSSFAESEVEVAALMWLGKLGYTVLYGQEIEPGGPHEQRATFGVVVLVERLRVALQQINLEVPGEAIEEAMRQIVQQTGGPKLV